MATDEVLGADLADLFRTGNSVLPGAAQSLRSAYAANPTFSSWVFSRPAGLGASDTGPAEKWQALAEQLDKALLRNATAVEKIATWMVDFTQDMATQDADVQRHFKRYGGELD